MDTMLIQLVDAKATWILHELEELQLIKVLSKQLHPKQKLSEKYAGRLPADVAEALQQYVMHTRSQWNKRSI